MPWPTLIATLALFAAANAALAQTAHQHMGRQTCSQLSLACAATVTPAFAPDGTLWIAARVNNQIFVAKSLDRGRSFTPPVAVTQDRMTLDAGPDAPKKTS